MKKEEEKKIYIETPDDLFKLPLNVLKNARVNNFKGKYFDQLYAEALKIEQNGGLVKLDTNPRKLVICTLLFEITYHTDFGQMVALLGSLPELGKWDEKFALKFDWTAGNVWRGKITCQENTDFEYKFIFLQQDKVQKWESGENRVFKYDLIKMELEKFLQSHDLDMDIVQLELNGQELIYSYLTKSLKIISKWK